MQSAAMAVQQPRTTPEEEEEQQEDGEFTFPTPPPQLLGVGAGGARGREFIHLAPPPCAASASSSPPVWLLSSSSSPIRRSFSAADCAASPWRDRVLLARRRLHGGCSSPALSDYAGAGFCEEEEEEEEERMDSLWEDLNDDDGAAARGEHLLFGRSLVVSPRRSVAATATTKGPRWVGKDKDPLAGVAVLGSSRSSRRRPPGLVTMMRALRRMFVAHKGKSRVHRDEQSTTSAYSFSRKG